MTTPSRTLAQSIVANCDRAQTVIAGDHAETHIALLALRLYARNGGNHDVYVHIATLIERCKDIIARTYNGTERMACRALIESFETISQYIAKERA